MVFVSLFSLKKKKRVDWESEKIIIELIYILKGELKVYGGVGGGRN
jgi:quercetin dioxygenase-like cupin family protein